jgi:hypothetical protein
MNHLWGKDTAGQQRITIVMLTFKELTYELRYSLGKTTEVRIRFLYINREGIAINKTIHTDIAFVPTLDIPIRI